VTVSGLYGGAIEYEEDQQQSHRASKQRAPISEEVGYAGHDFNAYAGFRRNRLKLY
jgi:hypothetical protein